MPTIMPLHLLKWNIHLLNKYNIGIERSAVIVPSMPGSVSIMTRSGTGAGRAFTSDDVAILYTNDTTFRQMDIGRTLNNGTNKSSFAAIVMVWMLVDMQS
jgi:hypothetical protein